MGNSGRPAATALLMLFAETAATPGELSRDEVEHLYRHALFAVDELKAGGGLSAHWVATRLGAMVDETGICRSDYALDEN